MALRLADPTFDQGAGGDIGGAGGAKRAQKHPGLEFFLYIHSIGLTKQCTDASRGL